MIVLLGYQNSIIFVAFCNLTTVKTGGCPCCDELAHAKELAVGQESAVS